MTFILNNHGIRYSAHSTALFAAATCKGLCQFRSLTSTWAPYLNKTSRARWFEDRQALCTAVNHSLSLLFTSAPHNKRVSIIVGSPLQMGIFMFYYFLISPRSEFVKIPNYQTYHIALIKNLLFKLNSVEYSWFFKSKKLANCCFFLQTL